MSDRIEQTTDDSRMTRAVHARRAEILDAAGRELALGVRRRRAVRALAVTGSVSVAVIAVALLLPMSRPSRIEHSARGEHATIAGSDAPRSVVPAARRIDFIRSGSAARSIDARRIDGDKTTMASTNIDFRVIGGEGAARNPIVLERIDDRAAEKELAALGKCVHIIRVDGEARILSCSG